MGGGIAIPHPGTDISDGKGVAMAPSGSLSGLKAVTPARPSLTEDGMESWGDRTSVYDEMGDPGGEPQPTLWGCQSLLRSRPHPVPNKNSGLNP